MRRKSIAVLTAAALALSAPAAFADQGGVPHSPQGPPTKPCPSKAKGKGPKKDAPNTNGRKCGFNR